MLPPPPGQRCLDSSTFWAISPPVAGGAVDGAELLVAPPGDVYLVTRVQAADLGPLLHGEMFHAMGEQPADPVQRVVLVAAAAQRVLLRRRTSSTAREPSLTTCNDDRDRDRVREPVVNGFAKPRNGSSAACSTPLTNFLGCAFSQA
jgi:hypothetical protein